MVLAVGLFVPVGWLLGEAIQDQNRRRKLAIVFLPRAVILPLLAVVLSAVASIRFSEHSQFGLGFLPRLAGNMAIFLLAAHAPKDRLPKLCRWWMFAAVIVAGNGLLRLG